MRNSIRSLTSWVVRHPQRTIGAVAVVTLLFLVAIFIMGIGFETDFKKFLPKNHPSVQALNRAEETYGSQDLFLVAVVAKDTIFKPETLDKFRKLEDRFAELDGVDDVRGPASSFVIYGTEDSVVVEEAMSRVPKTPEEVEAYRQRVMNDRNIAGHIISEDGKAAAILLTLDPFEAKLSTLVSEIKEITREFEGPEKIFPSGEPVLRDSVASSMTRDLRVLIPFVILIMLVVIYLGFRSIRSLILPMLTVLVSAIWAIGTMALFHSPITPFSILLPVMLIVIGAANGIHILNKYYEEVASRQGDPGSSREELIIATMREIAVPVMMTSLTTAVGFLGLVTSFMWPQRMFGIFTAVGVLYSMLLSLTLIPALLALLPAPRIRGSYEQSPLSGILARLGRGVQRAPVLTLALGVVVFLAFASAIPRLQVETRTDKFLGEDNPVVQALNVIEERFGGSRQLAVEIDTGRRDGLKDPETLRQIAALEDFLLQQPGVGDVASVATVVRQLNETLHASDSSYYRIPDDPRLAAQLFILYGGKPGQLFLGDYSKGEVIARVENLSSAQLSSLVGRVREYLGTSFNKTGQPKAELVGLTQAFAALTATMVPSQINSLIASLVAVSIIVGLLMGSWVAGLLSLVPLALTLAIEFGLMVYAGVPLDIGTLMLGSISIGVGVDYVIHFLSRYRVESATQRDAAAAFDMTMRTAGKGITYNAIALMLGFSVLLLSSFQALLNFGLLLVLTMFIASLTSFTVVPAILLLVKPAFLRKPLLAGSSATVEASIPTMKEE